MDNLIKRLDKVCGKLSFVAELESEEQYAAEESPDRSIRFKGLTEPQQEAAKISGIEILPTPNKEQEEKPL